MEDKNMDKIAESISKAIGDAMKSKLDSSLCMSKAKLSIEKDGVKSKVEMNGDGASLLFIAGDLSAKVIKSVAERSNIPEYVAMDLFTDALKINLAEGEDEE